MPGKADAADEIERQSSRPDFQILIYPGVQADRVEVSKDTPPTFLLCADNDKGPSTAIPAVYLALKKAGVPAELHIRPRACERWCPRCSRARWL